MIETTASKSFANRRGGTPVVCARKDEHCSHGAVSPCSARDGASTERGGYSVLIWLNLVCLDAPLVAITWAFLFARSFHLPIAFGAVSALFLTAWLIYLADRFGDSRSLGGAAATSLRQGFCARYRAAWLLGFSVIAATDLLVIGTRLDSRTLTIGAGIGACALAYLAANRQAPSLWRILPIKETSIGFLFAAGTMVPLVGRLTSAMLPAWLLFAFLCSLNCISIALWERHLDLVQQRISLATEFPEIGRYLQVALVLLAVICAALGFAAMKGGSVLLCAGVSAALLAGVQFFRNGVQTDVRTALADLALLTPMFALLF